MEENIEIPESSEPSKEELERQKILLEIKELKKEWWKKPAYIAALFPTVLALMTLIYGFANGYFQSAAIKLENEKHALQVEIEKIKKERDELQGNRYDLVHQIEEAQRLFKAQKECKDVNEGLERLRNNANSYNPRK